MAEVADINPRVVERPSGEDCVSFVRMSDLDAVAAVTSSGEARQFKEVSKGYTIFRDQDLLVAKITPCFENNKIGQANLRHAIGVGSTEFHVVRPRRDHLDGRYLLHFIRQERVRVDGERRMTGSAGQRRVPAAYLEELRVPLPPIDEQRRIAAILDQAYAVRAKRRQARSQAVELLRAIFLDMFGDPVTNPKGLPRRALRDWGCVATGNTPPRGDASNYGTGIEWIKSDNLSTDEFIATTAAERLSRAGEDKARVVSAGSILVTCIAGSPRSIGNCALVNRRVSFNQQINALTALRGDPYFLLAQLRVGKRLVQEKSTSGMKGLVNKSAFASIRLLDPPVVDQARFGNVLKSIAASLERQVRAAQAHDDLRVQLEHEAFRGAA